MNIANRLYRFFRPEPFVPRGKPSARAYAVGDIHGRADLLEQLLETIAEEIARLPRKQTFVIFLGDLIDRGPDSSAVLEQLRTWRMEGVTPVFLAGNHEEVMLSVLHGDHSMLADWLRFGGGECLASYGIDVDALKRLDPIRATQQVRAAVPREHTVFLESLGDTFRFGDYLFVHAGIRPGVPVEHQEVKDLRWIREPFLNDTAEHGYVVVHGHTISSGVEERPNRIGIDTGAYVTGNLTALVIENDRRWFLSTAGLASAGNKRLPAGGSFVNRS